MKLGDIVIIKGNIGQSYEITSFVEDFAVLKGRQLPIITVENVSKLITISRKRNSSKLELIT